jgi:hypothetical protein
LIYRDSLEKEAEIMFSGKSDNDPVTPEEVQKLLDLVDQYTEEEKVDENGYELEGIGSDDNA